MRVRLPSCAPGRTMDFFLNESRGRRRFKDLLGQANHLIVTSLVGLDGVEQGLVTTPPLDLHAAWSPKDPIISARRARRLLLDMVLVRAVDSVDVYSSSLSRPRAPWGSLLPNQRPNDLDAAVRMAGHPCLDRAEMPGRAHVQFHRLYSVSCHISARFDRG